MTPLDELDDPDLAPHRDYLLRRGFVYVEESLEDTRYWQCHRDQLPMSDSDPFGVDLDGLEKTLGRHALPLPDSEPIDFPLGPSPDLLPASEGPFDPVPPPEDFPDLMPDALPSTVNLINSFPPIQDQRRRNTCVAFAACALLERASIRAGTPRDFSEQFLYWACKQIDNLPDRPGTWLGYAFGATPAHGIRVPGCCLAGTWPYQPLSQSGTDAQGPPPSAALNEALQFPTPAVLSYGRTDVDALRQSLASGRPVAFTLPVHQSWWGFQSVQLSGNIPVPLASERPVSSHALCLVGYDDLRRRFFVRNSFGASWGAQSLLAPAHGPGYGTLPYEFVARLGMEAYALR